MIIEKKQTELFYPLLWLITITLLLTALLTEGTGGGGDSVYHYFYAHYAWQQPDLFFNHWAKPFFTFVASPFAQFGFKGIKIFNVLMSCGACLITYLTANLLTQKNSDSILILVFGAPLFFTVMLSGLTEPLSAFMLITSIYLWIKDKKIYALVLLSFLPFVRSEGLILIGVFVMYLVIKKQYRFIPWVAAGHIIMSLAGYMYYHDVLWVFNKIPYAHMSSVYGKGNWTHFIEQSYFCSGPVIFILMIIGGVSEIFSIIYKEHRSVFFTEKLILVYGSFVAFIISHSAFWALGIFNSMGLNRVLVTVYPLVAIIALDGLNFILERIGLTYQKWVLYAIISAACIFPLLDNPASFEFKKSVSLDNQQKLIKTEVLPLLQRSFPNSRYMAEPSVALFTNRNPFDTTQFKSIYNLSYKNLLPGDVFIWDNWFARVEGGIEKTDVINSNALKTEGVFNSKDLRGNIVEYIVFSKK